MQGTNDTESATDQMDQEEQFLHKLLGGHSVCRMKLKKLDKLLEGHKDHVLEAYIFWFQESFIADTAPKDHLTEPQVRAPLLQSWCARLNNYGFNAQHIFDTIRDRTAYQINTDAVKRVNVEKIKEELRSILFRRVKKNHKLDRAPVNHDNVPSSLQNSDSHTSKINDNKEYLKAILESNKTDTSGRKKLEIIEILSDSESEADTVGCNQRRHRYPLQLTNNSHLATGLTPSARAIESIEKMLAKSKQNFDPDCSHESRLPPSIGISAQESNDKNRETTENQPPHISSMYEGSGLQFDGIHDGGDAVVHVNKQMQEFRADAIKRRQEAEAQKEASKSERFVKKLNTRGLDEVSKGKSKQLTSKFDAYPVQHSTRKQDPIRKLQKPHNDYLCYRCEVPGHFLQDCPTNLDPSFDSIPVGGYKCMICGRIKAHLTSLCPENTDPQSLTQLRLKLGIVTTMRVHDADNHRPPYGEKERGRREQRGSLFGVMDKDFENVDHRRAVLELSEDEDGQILDQDDFGSRCMRAKRAYSRPESPRDIQKNDRYASPPPKRVRMDYRTRRRSHEHARSPGRQSHQDFSLGQAHLIQDIPSVCSEKSRANHVFTSELFESLDCSRIDRGRLSYWDGEYQTPPGPRQSSPSRYGGPAFSSSPLRTKKRASAEEFWSEDIVVEKIRQLFPNADPRWVDEMASFDVDPFFEAMDDLILLTPFHSQSALCGMEIIAEHPDESGHSPRVFEVAANIEDVEGRGSVAAPYRSRANEFTVNVGKVKNDKIAQNKYHDGALSATDFGGLSE